MWVSDTDFLIQKRNEIDNDIQWYISQQQIIDEYTLHQQPSIPNYEKQKSIFIF